jgi:putative restriction endonuclease
MANDRHFGDIPDVPVGALFDSRLALSRAGVHRPTMAGISGTSGEGADSIVLNGGYEDDKDFGDVIIYTGHGGNDPNTGRQVADQELRSGNQALAKSCIEGLPVRVVRGWKEPSGLGPKRGFRYDGLYNVERYWAERGRSGFRIWRYRLVKTQLQPTQPERDATETPGPAPRQATTIQRIVRNSVAALRVKELHGYTCQICGIRLETPAGPYAESAHIRPLGSPHDGPDEPSNILCLCSNHHVLLDLGALVVAADLNIQDTVTGAVLGRLRQVHGHQVSPEYLAYHRQLFGTRSVRPTYEFRLGGMSLRRGRGWRGGA